MEQLSLWRTQFPPIIKAVMNDRELLAYNTMYCCVCRKRYLGKRSLLFGEFECRMPSHFLKFACVVVCLAWCTFSRWNGMVLVLVPTSTVLPVLYGAPLLANAWPAIHSTLAWLGNACSGFSFNMRHLQYAFSTKCTKPSKARLYYQRSTHQPTSKHTFKKDRPPKESKDTPLLALVCNEPKFIVVGTSSPLL